MTHAPDVASVAERLRADGVDVIRVSYPDLIGVDRGRDVLLDELGSAVEHGLAFCRAVYHTSPMGDVVPVQGGLDSGLPDITVRPDLATLTPLPWEPNAAWCLGDACTPDGAPAPESPRMRHPAGGGPVRRARLHPGLRPRAGVLPVRTGPGRLVAALRERPGQCVCGRPQGRPAGRAGAHAPPAQGRWPAGHHGQPRILARPVRDQPRPLGTGRCRRPLVPAQIRGAGDRPASRADGHLHGQAVQR